MTNKTQRLRSIAELEHAWSRLMTGEEAREADAHAKVMAIVREAAPHSLSTEITAVKSARTDDNGPCLVLCAMRIARGDDAARDEHGGEAQPATERWVDPAAASLYDPRLVIQLLVVRMNEHDRNGEWHEAEKICLTLARVLKTPTYRQADDVKEAIRRIDWGRIPRALPETYRRTKTAAQERSGLTAIALAAAMAGPTT